MLKIKCFPVILVLDDTDEEYEGYEDESYRSTIDDEGSLDKLGKD